MTTSVAGGPRLLVVFDGRCWADDVRRIGARGRALADTTRRRLEREGVPLAELHRCQPEAPGGTALSGCVKLYFAASLLRRGGSLSCIDELLPDFQVVERDRSRCDQSQPAGRGQRFSPIGVVDHVDA
jgi:hypothetical protein